MRPMLLWLLLALLPSTLGIAEGGFSADTHYTLLLIGQDQAAQEAIGPIPYGRADAVLIASVNLSDGQSRLISVDRDLLVDVPGAGQTKLCLTLYLGGPRNVVSAMNAAYGLSITDYVLVGWEGMAELIDAMGGVSVEIMEEDLPLVSPVTGACAFERAGVQMLDGAQAVAFMEDRSNDSDIARNARQRRVLSSMVDQLAACNLPDLLRLMDVVFTVCQVGISPRKALELAQFAATNGGIDTPLEMRAPENAKRRFVNMHYVLVSDDPEAERERVRSFLYE